MCGSNISNNEIDMDNDDLMSIVFVVQSEVDAEHLTNLFAGRTGVFGPNYFKERWKQYSRPYTQYIVVNRNAITDVSHMSIYSRYFGVDGVTYFTERGSLYFKSIADLIVRLSSFFVPKPYESKHFRITPAPHGDDRLEFKGDVGAFTGGYMYASQIPKFIAELNEIHEQAEARRANH